MAGASLWHRTKYAAYRGAELGSSLGMVGGILFSVFMLPATGGASLIGVMIPPIIGYFGGGAAGAGLAAGSQMLFGSAYALSRPFSHTAHVTPQNYDAQMQKELVHERKVMRAKMMEEVAENYVPKDKVRHLERLLAERERALGIRVDGR